jgi:hypothetical protein
MHKDLPMLVTLDDLDDSFFIKPFSFHFGEPSSFQETEKKLENEKKLDPRFARTIHENFWKLD